MDFLFGPPKILPGNSEIVVFWDRTNWSGLYGETVDAVDTAKLVFDRDFR